VPGRSPLEQPQQRLRRNLARACVGERADDVRTQPIVARAVEPREEHVRCSPDVGGGRQLPLSPIREVIELEARVAELVDDGIRLGGLRVEAFPALGVSEAVDQRPIPFDPAVGPAIAVDRRGEGLGVAGGRQSPDFPDRGRIGFDEADVRMARVDGLVAFEHLKRHSGEERALVVAPSKRRQTGARERVAPALVAVDEAALERRSE